MNELTETKQPSNPSAGHGRPFDTIHCLMLPLHKEIAVLPNAAVAEIIPYLQPQPVENAPEWLFGYLSWRERRVPVVSFELASEGQAGKIHKSCRIAIVNTLNGGVKLPYFGLITQSLPSLQVVRANNVQYEDVTIERPSVKAVISVNGSTAVIPDIDDLETRLLRLQENT